MYFASSQPTVNCKASSMVKFTMDLMRFLSEIYIFFLYHVFVLNDLE